MFEKSLYDLIRGLRNHKGNEREYIQHSLKECRAEIRSPDMDLKTTALLKLIYLEMFGHDMSWASFHVLEVMSSAKYLQKRVGYLGAVQSFRPDTEVLMLATNLLKKDLMSPQPATISLPLVTLPHIITPSLALSLLSDILPRLSHSQAAIRKKAIVTLYRLALVYPETLRPAWPRIKERLMDEQEDSSVTAAIVNVVCELGWRRPQDFLPLAPRLFDLLVDGGNNWMAIKIIKLFATLTPLEPRLVRKLLPPLTTIIHTTPAMSLLYECINGIIQGGILSGAEGTSAGEEIATLCVGKLRGMIAIEGDPNLKYVALLAFEKIVASHPHLVALHQDVVLDCIEDADISIRLRALELVVGMVDGDNLQSVVGRLMGQLRDSPTIPDRARLNNERNVYSGVEPSADSEDEDPEESLRPTEQKSRLPPPLPHDYRVNVINRVLDMCAKDNYSRVRDFVWYINVLLQLIRLSPSSSTSRTNKETVHLGNESDLGEEVSTKIGLELRNVAVRVRSVRMDATRAAESLVQATQRLDVPTASSDGSVGFLGPASWVVGEYADFLLTPDDTLSAMLHASVRLLRSDILAIYLQAIPKVFARITVTNRVEWGAEQRSLASLLIARIIHFLESVVDHPSLEVQERAVEILELMRLTTEAITSQEIQDIDGDRTSAPLLLTDVIPSLFTGMELNPVAPGAQKKVPLPDALDLNKVINPNLTSLIRDSEQNILDDSDQQEQKRLYHERPAQQSSSIGPAADRLDEAMDIGSYQQSPQTDESREPEMLAKQRAQRRERQRDDPFYIPFEDTTSNTTPLHNIIRSSNGDQLDIDAIPIMDLDLDQKVKDLPHANNIKGMAKIQSHERQPVDVMADETLPEAGSTRSATGTDHAGFSSGRGRVALHNKPKQSLLQVDSSTLDNFSLEAGEGGRDTPVSGVNNTQEDDEEMAAAMKEVERLRLEMQRASERIEAANGIPPEGTLVKKKTEGGTSSHKHGKRKDHASEQTVAKSDKPSS